MGTNKAEGKRSLKEMENEEEEEEDNEDSDSNICGLGFGNEHDKKKKGKMGSSNSGSMAVVLCQAENCVTDMTNAKRYHRRHKVCEFHAKVPFVLVIGTQQRFCQQCSRFHALSEFDENKRSCRRRLAGHNERRRKNSNDYHGEASN